jgi:hypothetical protein
MQTEMKSITFLETEGNLTEWKHTSTLEKMLKTKFVKLIVHI